MHKDHGRMVESWHVKEVDGEPWSLSGFSRLGKSSGWGR